MRIDEAGAVLGVPSPGAPATPRLAPGAAGARPFGETLRTATEDLRLSRHAQKRVDRRDLDLDPARLQRLNSAVDRAAEKGAKNSVVMLDDLAVVVDVRARMVVTAMAREGGRERVFTNIDSVVIA